MNWKLKLGEMLQTTEQGLIKLNSKFVWAEIGCLMLK